MKVLSKKYYLSIGSLSTVLAIGCFAASALFYIDPVQGVDFDRVKNAAISSCAASFNGDKTYLNLNADKVGNKVTVMGYGIEEWEGKFNMASHVLSECQGMSLTKMCFGEDCNISELTGDKTKPMFHNGLYFEMEFDEKNIDPRVKKTW